MRGNRIEDWRSQGEEEERREEEKKREKEEKWKMQRDGGMSPLSSKKEVFGSLLNFYRGDWTGFRNVSKVKKSKKKVNN